MSDDLVKRLRNPVFYSHPTTEDGVEAATRIEALEAALLAADELALAAHGTIHDDADTSLIDALAACRARRATGGGT